MSEHREVVEVTPHQLGAEDAVRGGAELEGALDVLRVVVDAVELRVVGRGAELLRVAEDVADVGGVGVTEVAGGRAGPAGAHARLEELLGAAGHARALERLAQEGAAAALGGAYEVGGRGGHRLTEGNKVYGRNRVSRPAGRAQGAGRRAQGAGRRAQGAGRRAQGAGRRAQ